MITATVNSSLGQITPTNWDGTLITKNNNIDLFIVMDGCSHKSKSGQFVSLMLNKIEGSFNSLSADSLTPSNLKSTLLEIIESSRKHVMYNCIPASMSIAILTVIDQKVAMIFHCGDCAIGQRLRDGSIYWKTTPHTIVNKPVHLLKENPDRHCLTKSLKSTQPTNLEGPIVFPFNTLVTLVLATDGWWDQESQKESKYQDDATIIEVTRTVYSLANRKALYGVDNLILTPGFEQEPL